MNPQEIDSNFQTLPNAIFTITFKPLGWPKVIFAQKRLSRKSKKNVIVWRPRNRRNTYIWSIWALFEIRRSNPKRTPKLARRRPSFDDRFELWTALKCFRYNCLDAFELCEAALFRAKIVPTEAQKKAFWRPRKAPKCLHIQRLGDPRNSRERISVSLI